MTTMLERAIRAGLEASIVGIIRQQNEAMLAQDWPEKYKQQLRLDIARNEERSRHECEPVIRAALLAALDPEDEKAIERMARRMAAEAGCLQAYERGDSSLVSAWFSSARAGMRALRDTAQGET